MRHGVVGAVLFALVLSGAFVASDASADGCRDGGCRSRSFDRCGSARCAPCSSSCASHTYYPSWWGARPWGQRVGCGCDTIHTRCAPFARRCGYRFHVGPRWANLVYDRRAYAWPSFVQVGDVGDDAADEAVAAPAVPLGPRAEAHEALFAGDAVTAEAKFRALTVADPADAAAWIGVAHACLCRTDYADAAAALDKAAALGAISPTQRLDVAATFAEPDDFRRRMDAVRVRTRFSAMDAGARTVLAWLEAGTGESSESVAEAKYVLTARPASPCARVLAGLPPEPPPAPATVTATK